MSNIIQPTVQPIVDWTWREKYRHVKPDGTSDEHTIDDTHRRVVTGVYKKDINGEIHSEAAFNLLKDQVFCPAGRIHAGAGTSSRVTLINCFVSPTIQDSMRTLESDERWGPDSLGIGDALLVALYTQQMGGGIGMDFSTLRPDGAIVKRTNSIATGPLPFMDMWNAMCATVKSAGSRRGAMMGVMRCDHPDIYKFIREKRTKDRLTNFNVSVLVTEKFMDAVARDLPWDLVFNVPPANRDAVSYPGVNGEMMYVYETVKARDLYDTIIRSTYDYAEPGIIFIDRVNEWNNLYYCEKISATNPCGEQPLPPNGDCNLSAQNLARMIINPFEKDAEFNFDLLKYSTHIGMRFLDNVLDVSLFPTVDQAEEARMKRRTGMGVTGLGNALQQLCIPYGNNESINVTGDIMRTLRDAAYRTSIELAKERGPFPLFDRDKYMDAKFIKTLPEDIREGIYEHGIRNSVLLTIAPTGTTSLYYGNVSSGIEPTFAWKYRRKVREHDGTYTEFEEVYDYGYLLYKEKFGEPEKFSYLPDYMVSAMNLPVEAHVNIQAVCQKYVDASISKTINVPADMPFEDFKNVYTVAYESGCKGCTTYRPSDVRGSVMSVDEEKKPEAKATVPTVAPRPEQLEGTTYKVKYPGMKEAFYITLNDIVREDGTKAPFEIFINSKSVKHQEWVVALTRMLSAIFRRGGDVAFIVEELAQVHSSMGGAFVKQKYMPSLVAFIGSVIEQHFIKIGLIADSGVIVPPEVAEGVKKLFGKAEETTGTLGAVCPNCDSPTYFKQEGCGKCTSCGYSDCG